MRELLKDYGPAIGPALAFMLGLLALWVKHLIDGILARHRLIDRLTKLRELIQNSAPPEWQEPNEHLDQLGWDGTNNITNFARFYSRLIALNSFITNLLAVVHSEGTVAEVQRLHEVKWWVDILIGEVAAFRAAPREGSLHGQFVTSRGYWRSLEQAVVSDGFRYVGRDSVPMAMPGD